MTLLSTIIVSCGFSAACLELLSRQNAKRRRAHKLPPIEHTAIPSKLLLTGVLTPGLILAALQQGAGFVIWLSIITVLGWLISVKQPKSMLK